VLDELIGRDLARQLPRRPGQKEDRYEHLLGGDAQRGARGSEPQTPPPPAPELDRLGELERSVQELSEEVASLRREVDELRRG
jgi:hypothetical protein